MSVSRTGSRSPGRRCGVPAVVGVGRSASTAGCAGTRLRRMVVMTGRLGAGGSSVSCWVPSGTADLPPPAEGLGAELASALTLRASRRCPTRARAACARVDRCSPAAAAGEQPATSSCGGTRAMPFPPASLGAAAQCRIARNRRGFGVLRVGAVVRGQGYAEVDAAAALLIWWPRTRRPHRSGELCPCIRCWQPKRTR